MKLHGLLKKSALLMLVLVVLMGCAACGKAEVESTILTDPLATTAAATTEAVSTTKPAETETEPTTEPVAESTETFTDPVEETTEPVKETTVPEESADTGNQRDYVLNTNSKKFHYPDCSSVNQMKDSNRADFHGTRDELIARGYSPCGRCKP